MICCSLFFEKNFQLFSVSFLKAVFIIGIGGAFRKCELLNLTTQDVVDKGDCLSIVIKDTKNYDDRDIIIIPGSINGNDLLSTLCRYIALRPSNTTTDRFFIGYRAGKCFRQPVGINIFSSMPSKIAQFLGLENASYYTGHCFRHSSATILAEGEATLTTIKRVGGWRSSKVAEGYIHNSHVNKRKAATTIFGTGSNCNW